MSSALPVISRVTIDELLREITREEMSDSGNIAPRRVDNFARSTVRKGSARPWTFIAKSIPLTRSYGIARAVSKVEYDRDAISSCKISAR